MSLKIKLMSMVSAFVLVLSMLLVGVLAATGSFTINLKGNVQFNIDDSTLYIKDIRLSDGLTAGETIDNFLPGFAGESFELDFGTISSNSGTISIEIDVINTTATKYSASSQSSLSNATATLSVSGTIAGDSVPLDQVATYDGTSGTIYISVQVTSSTTINLNNIVIDITEQTGYTATIANSSGFTLYAMGDDGQIRTISNGSNIEVNTSSISFAYTSNVLQGISTYAPESNPGAVIEPGTDEDRDDLPFIGEPSPDPEVHAFTLSFYNVIISADILGGDTLKWSINSEDENITISEDEQVLTIKLTEDTEFSFSY